MDRGFCSGDNNKGTTPFYLRICFIPKLYWYSLLLVFVVSSFDVLGEDVRIGRTSMNVSSGSSIVFKNSISVSADAVVNNDGEVYFKNSNEATININTILNGEGGYHLNGNDNYIIEGDGGAVSSLILESGKTLQVNSDFSVTNNLFLESGIISVADNVRLKILNTSADAISFNDSYNNDSFIEGTLSRNVIPGISYTFPLGASSSGYHPFVIQDVSSSGYIGVNYLEGLAGEWNSKENNNNIRLIEDMGGWQVSADAGGIKFVPLLSLYTLSGQLNDDDYNIFYCPDINASTPGFKLDYNSKIVDDGSYLSTATKYGSGVFAFNKVEKVDDDDDTTTDPPKLVNFIVTDGTGRTNFEVPGIEEYDKIILSVYNRFGALVYKNDTYANDFDTRNYRSGTYYYELILVTNTEEKILVRNFFEIMEHK